MKGMLLSCERMPNFRASELSARLKAVGAAASRCVWAAKPQVADSNVEENLSGLYKSAGISCDRAAMVARSCRAALLHLLHWRAPFSLASVNPSCVGSIHLQTLYCPRKREQAPCHTVLSVLQPLFAVNVRSCGGVQWSCPGHCSTLVAMPCTTPSMLGPVVSGI